MGAAAAQVVRDGSCNERSADKLLMVVQWIVAGRLLLLLLLMMLIVVAVLNQSRVQLHELALGWRHM